TFVCIFFSKKFNCFNFFFFSSRRRHTRFSRDWSSDVLFRSCLFVSFIVLQKIILQKIILQKRNSFNPMIFKRIRSNTYQLTEQFRIFFPHFPRNGSTQTSSNQRMSSSQL